MWCQPCRPMEEREHQRTLNTARRYLHTEREKSKVPPKTFEHVVELPVIGGKYYPVAKACISWKGVEIAKVVEGQIQWTDNETLDKTLGKDLANSQAEEFQKSWSELLR